MPTKSATADAGVLDWEKLMQDIDQGSQNTNTNNQQDLDFSEFDQWLSEGQAVNDSAETVADADHGQILSPPLYSGFPSVARTEGTAQPRVDGASFVDGLSSWIRALQAE